VSLNALPEKIEVNPALLIVLQNEASCVAALRDVCATFRAITRANRTIPKPIQCGIYWIFAAPMVVKRSLIAVSATPRVSHTMRRRLNERPHWENVKENLARMRADHPCEWGCFVCPASPQSRTKVNNYAVSGLHQRAVETVTPMSRALNHEKMMGFSL